MQAIEVAQALPVLRCWGGVDANAGGSHGDAALGASRCGRQAHCGGTGCSKNTVKRYLRAGGWIAYRKPERGSRLAGLQDWLAERFRQHRDNADVVRQDLEREHAIAVSLRTVERAVQPLRQALRAEAVATIRFETARQSSCRSTSAR